MKQLFALYKRIYTNKHKYTDELIDIYDNLNYVKQDIEHYVIDHSITDCQYSNDNTESREHFQYVVCPTREIVRGNVIFDEDYINETDFDNILYSSKKLQKDDIFFNKKVA